MRLPLLWRWLALLAASSRVVQVDRELPERPAPRALSAPRALAGLARVVAPRAAAYPSGPVSGGRPRHQKPRVGLPARPVGEADALLPDPAVLREGADDCAVQDFRGCWSALADLEEEAPDCSVSDDAGCWEESEAYWHAAEERMATAAAVAEVAAAEAVEVAELARATSNDVWRAHRERELDVKLEGEAYEEVRLRSVAAQTASARALALAETLASEAASLLEDLPDCSLEDDEGCAEEFATYEADLQAGEAEAAAAKARAEAAAIANQEAFALASVHMKAAWEAQDAAEAAARLARQAESDYDAYYSILEAHLDSAAEAAATAKEAAARRPARMDGATASTDAAEGTEQEK